MIDWPPAGVGQGRHWPPQLMGLSQMPLRGHLGPLLQRVLPKPLGFQASLSSYWTQWVRPGPSDFVSKFLTLTFDCFFLGKISYRKEDHLQFSIQNHFFLFIYLFYSSIVDLQCCVNFYCITKWFSYTHICILFHILLHYGLWLNYTEYSFLCYTVGPCCIAILHILVCIC